MSNRLINPIPLKISKQKALEYYNLELSVLDKNDELYIRELCAKKEYLDGSDIIAIRTYIEKSKNQNKMKAIKETSNFLSAKEYEKGKQILCIFQDAGKQEEGKFGKVYHFQVEAGEKTESGSAHANLTAKTLSLSGKNWNETIDKLGDETEQWIGAGITLLVVASDKAACGKSFQVI